MEGVTPGKACPRCMTVAPHELELDVRPAPAPRAAKSRSKPEEEMPLELAIDPRALVQQRSAESRGPSAPPVYAAASAPVMRGAPATLASYPRPPAGPVQPALSDLEVDARVLAEYGEPPRSWILAPFYAWKVLRRQRGLKGALAGRRAEAEHAGTAHEDALVAFLERVRPAAEKQPTYAAALEDLSRAEDTLRSRDRVLATDQDAHGARLAQVDGRIGKLEADLVQAQTDERVAATELSSAQGSLAREEAKLKRAESELKAAVGRGGSGGGA
jgi:hypothetical protein